MKILRILFFVLCSGLSPGTAADVDTQYLQGLSDTHYKRIDSNIIGRPYHVFVMLPKSYADTKIGYPTVYLLDGGSLFPLLSAYYRYLELTDEVRESVIVGISYGSGTFEGGNYRSTDYTAPSSERDYWGGADKYQKFLSQELFPYIETTYRSRPDRRIVFGQSLGGQFVLYTALTKPDCFWGHIASNPALHRNLPFFLQTHHDPESARQPSKLFVGSGTRDDPRFRQPAMEWQNHWSKKADKPWLLKFMHLEGQTHVSAAPEAFRQGMTWLFATE